MLLVIDVGNTNGVFALYEGETLRQSWRLQTVRGRTADEYAAFLGPMFHLAGVAFGAVKDVLVSSVVPETHFALRGFCETYLGRVPHFLTKDSIPIEIALDRPEDVGADRLVNALAVKVFYRFPAIVIDFGTATTFDVIDQQGRYAGGVIAPGLELSLEALHKAASKLPKVTVQKPPRVIGKHTTEAMQAGLYWGYVGLTEGIVARIKAELGGDVFVLATGGLATLFAGDMPFIETVDQDLTLKGLQIVYNFNERKP